MVERRRLVSKRAERVDLRTNSGKSKESETTGQDGCS